MHMHLYIYNDLQNIFITHEFNCENYHKADSWNLK